MNLKNQISELELRKLVDLVTKELPEALETRICAYYSYPPIPEVPVEEFASACGVSPDSVEPNDLCENATVNIGNPARFPLSVGNFHLDSVTVSIRCEHVEPDKDWGIDLSPKNSTFALMDECDACGRKITSILTDLGLTETPER